MEKKGEVKYAKIREIIRQNLSNHGLENIPLSTFLIGSESAPFIYPRMYLQSSIHRTKLHFYENGFNTNALEQMICVRPSQSRSAVNALHNLYCIKHTVDNIYAENVYQILLEEGQLRN